MKRMVRLAATVWLGIAVFAAVNRAFEFDVLEPWLGGDLSDVLGTAALAMVVLVTAFLWLGTRKHVVTAFEAATISATWACGGLVLALAISGKSFLGSEREAAVFLAASALAPWIVRWTLSISRPRPRLRPVGLR